MTKFGLTEEEHENWFQKVIKPMFVDGKKTAEKPTLVLLTAQSGAGKTFASVNYAKQMAEEPIRFGADDLRILLPYAQDVLDHDEANYPFITKKDASLAREKIVEHAIANKQNILIETILGSPDDWKLGTVMKAKNAGYRIECVALGVHQYVSQVSMFSRYEEQKMITGHGFAPTLEVHDRAYHLLPEIAAKMYEGGIADSVKVYNRRFENFYDTDKEETPSGIGIMRGIVRSRNSYLNYDEMRWVMVKWEDVLDKMQNRNASPEEVENVRMLYGSFKKASGIYLAPNSIGQGITPALINKNSGKSGK